jgi:hypothetical protein
MLAMALHLRSQGMSLRDIAARRSCGDSCQGAADYRPRNSYWVTLLSSTSTSTITGITYRTYRFAIGAVPSRHVVERYAT